MVRELGTSDDHLDGAMRHEYVQYCDEHQLVDTSSLNEIATLSSNPSCRAPAVWFGGGSDYGLDSMFVS